MNLREYIEALQKLAQQDPDALEYEVRSVRELDCGLIVADSPASEPEIGYCTELDEIVDSAAVEECCNEDVQLYECILV